MNGSFSTARGMLTVREASPADAIPFRELRLDALQDSPTAFSADHQRHLSLPLHNWENMLTMQSDEETIFLAEHDTGLIGMTGVARGGVPKTRHRATVWGVYVRPAWRGLRVAEELIRASLAWARARKIVAAHLGVTTSNKAAIRCYERCGFRITGTDPRALYFEDQYYDFHTMYCALDNP